MINGYWTWDIQFVKYGSNIFHISFKFITTGRWQDDRKSERQDYDVKRSYHKKLSQFAVQNLLVKNDYKN